MVARPPFEVSLSKGGETSLLIQCSFPEHDAVPEQEQEEESFGKFQADLFSVDQSLRRG